MNGSLVVFWPSRPQTPLDQSGWDPFLRGCVAIDEKDENMKDTSEQYTQRIQGESYCMFGTAPRLTSSSHRQTVRRRLSLKARFHLVSGGMYRALRAPTYLTFPILAEHRQPLTLSALFSESSQNSSRLILFRCLPRHVPHGAAKLELRKGSRFSYVGLAGS